MNLLNKITPRSRGRRPKRVALSGLNAVLPFVWYSGYRVLSGQYSVVTRLAPI